MAEKRMFSNKITQSDAFLSMPRDIAKSILALVNGCDDEGFVNRPKSIMRMVGASDDDMNILIAKKFIIPFNVANDGVMSSMVCVIKHWFINNYIRPDRLKETSYSNERGMLTIQENGSYSFDLKHENDIDGQLPVNCPNRLDKNRLDENRLDESSIETQKQSSIIKTPRKSAKKTKSKHGLYGHVKLTDDEYKKLKNEYNNHDELIQHLDDYCEMHDKSYKNYYLAIKKWVVEAVNKKNGINDKSRKTNDSNAFNNFG
ncbi:hypothetical protein MGH68_12135 [Erysipelothrix sp. D19-032]